MTTLTLAELAEDVQEFLRFKRAMGFSYRRAEFMLESLKRFAHSRSGGRHRLALDEILKAWLSRSEGRKANSIAMEFAVVRQLCLHRRRRDPHGFVPERAWAPKTELPFLPYIFSHKEVRQILAAAKRYDRGGITPRLIHTLILVLYCTGLRFGEAVRLELRDVDLGPRTFLVRESKGRTRIVPFGKDLCLEIARWLQERTAILSDRGIASETAMFVRRDGRRLSVRKAGAALTDLVREEGLKPPRGRIGPRPYDWRHAFAVHRLTDWYRKGIDIHARLPWLSAYMGHVNVLGTEVYLHATPELLQLASRRLAGRLRSAGAIRRPRS
jgi:site-specific recombinase XerD